MSTASTIFQALTFLVLATLLGLYVHDRIPPAPAVAQTQQWEYKTLVCNCTDPVVSFKPQEDESTDYYFKMDEVRKMGSDGWELCAAVPEVETKFPKDGLSGAILGSNVRSYQVTLIFKRHAD